MDIYRIKHQPLSRIFVTSKTVKLNIEAVIALGMTFKAEETMPDGTQVMMMVAEDGKPLRGIAAFNKTFLVKAERVPEVTEAEELAETINIPVTRAEELLERQDEIEAIEDAIEADAASDSSPVTDLIVNRDNEYPLTDMKAVRAAIRDSKALAKTTKTEVLVFGTASIVKYLNDKGIKKLHNGPMEFNASEVQNAGNKWITIRIGEEIYYAKRWDSTAFIAIEQILPERS